MEDDIRYHVHRMKLEGYKRSEIAKRLKLPKMVVLAVLQNIPFKMKDGSRKDLTHRDFEKMRSHRTQIEEVVKELHQAGKTSRQIAIDLSVKGFKHDNGTLYSTEYINRTIRMMKDESKI